MRKKLIEAEPFRFSLPGYQSKSGDRCGVFQIPRGNVVLRVIASDGSGWHESGLPGPPWEHVSVSLQTRTPTWEEMDYVKRLFFEDHETVVQFHVPPSDHVNFHPFCLHLWRLVKGTFPRPPAETVGPRT